ncbi:uncharacterized protein LOC134833211 [Culicoides brevitarsis]|uniref:uncharacterized protein LOC134833211 n=1 Tax=Culicoides brevitarsis TaxID=469753 RepID=UPI00307BDD1F
MSTTVSKTHVSEEVRSSYPMVTRLIEEVRKRPQLWNPNHYLHHTRPLIGDNWEEIANVIGNPSKLFTNSRLLSMSNASLTPSNLVKTKWKGLRDNFRKEVKKCLRLGNAYIPWIHFRACSFLWSVLDTSQLEATPEQIEELKKQYGGDQVVDLDGFEQTNYHLSSRVTNDNDDSMDFHDYIFADEVPVKELLKQEQASQLQAGYDPHLLEEGEIVSADPNDEEDIQIIEPIIEQVEVPDDDEDVNENLSRTREPPPLRLPSLKITEPRTIKKAPLKKIVPLRILKKVPTLPKLTPIIKTKITETSTKESEQQIVTHTSSTTPQKNDSDLHFLKSIYPYLKQINSKRKLHIKGKIRQMLLDEMKQNSSRKENISENSTVMKVVSNGKVIVKEETELNI